MQSDGNLQLYKHLHKLLIRIDVHLIASVWVIYLICFCEAHMSHLPKSDLFVHYNKRQQ